MSVKKPVLETETVLDFFSDLDQPVQVDDNLDSLFETVLEPTPIEVIEEGYLTILDCGHTNFFAAHIHEEARAKGHCCAGDVNNAPISWGSLKGVYVRPLPVHLHRTVARMAGPGFPGYCVDAGGFYIGGVTNNCTTDRPEGSDMCAAHRALSKSKASLDNVVSEKSQYHEEG